MRTPAILVLAFALALPATAQPAHIQAPGAPATGPYTHEATGIIFPAAIGEFRRFRLTPDPGATGLSAGYAYVTATARMAATVILMRPPKALPNPPGMDLCHAMAQAGQQLVRTRTPQAKLGPLEPLPVAAGWRATGFSVRTPGTGPLTGASERYFYCTQAGDLGVFFDFQHAPEFEAAALEKAFIEGFALPAR
jgi:hypothetical protein